MAYKEKYKIAVSGAAELRVCQEDAVKLAEQTGRAIVQKDCILISGATTGIPNCAALAVKKARGISIGFSPEYRFIETGCFANTVCPYGRLAGSPHLDG